MAKQPNRRVIRPKSSEENTESETQPDTQSKPVKEDQPVPEPQKAPPVSEEPVPEPEPIPEPVSAPPLQENIVTIDAEEQANENTVNQYTSEIRSTMLRNTYDIKTYFNLIKYVVSNPTPATLQAFHNFLYQNYHDMASPKNILKGIENLKLVNNMNLVLNFHSIFMNFIKQGTIVDRVDISTLDTTLKSSGVSNANIVKITNFIRSL